MITDLFSSIDGAYVSKLWILPLLRLLCLRGGLRRGATVAAAFGALVRRVGHNGDTQRYCFIPLLAGTVFSFILFTNLIGLSPFTYTLSRDLIVVARLGVLLWLLILASGYTLAPLASLGHLAPGGAPFVLQPFLVLVESIRLLIRPLTLTVRLVANISAGHIVLGLIANVNSSMIHSICLPLCLLLSIGYTLFEFFVAAIQAYIFTLLITLYGAEHP